MKVPNTRYNLLTLTATILVVILLALMNLGSRGGGGVCGAGQFCGSPQAGPSGPSAEALHLLVGRSL